MFDFGPKMRCPGIKLGKIRLKLPPVVLGTSYEAGCDCQDSPCCEQLEDGWTPGDPVEVEITSIG